MPSLNKIAQESFSNEMQKLALKGTGAFAKALAKRRLSLYKITPDNFFSILNEPRAIRHLLKGANGKRLSEKLIHQPVVSQMLHEAKTLQPDSTAKLVRNVSGLRRYWETAKQTTGSFA